MNKDIRLALDVGNRNIKFILGRLSEIEKEVEVLDILSLKSEGITKSIVNDKRLLSEVIKRGKEELEHRNKLKLNKVSLGIGHNKIKSRTEHSELEFEEHEIDIKDIKNLIKKVSDAIILENEVIIEEEAYNIKINDSGVIKNPIGVVAKKLQGNIHLISIDKDNILPLIEAINLAGLSIDKIFLNASSSAKSTLDIEDRQKGVALIDIGEGITNIALYKNDKIIYTKSISIGGMHYVSDISKILGISLEESEEIIRKIRNNDYKNGIIKTKNAQYDIEKTQINEILNARTGDLIKFITDSISESGFNGYLKNGLTFTGGAITIENIHKEIKGKMEYISKIVLPKQTEGINNLAATESAVLGTLLARLEIDQKGNDIENIDKINENKLTIEIINSEFINNEALENPLLIENNIIKKIEAEEIQNNHLMSEEILEKSFVRLDDELKNNTTEEELKINKTNIVQEDEDIESDVENKKEGFFRRILSNFI